MQVPTLGFGVTLVVCFSLFLGGCSGIGRNHEGKFPFIHGNFCGDNHPADNPSYNETQKKAKGYIEWRVKELQSIPYVDAIDYVCKLHDICYVRAGGPDVECDEKLSYNISVVTKALPGLNEVPVGVRTKCTGKYEKCYELSCKISAFAESEITSLSPQRIRWSITPTMRGAGILAYCSSVEILNKPFGCIFGRDDSCPCNTSADVATLPLLH